MLFSLIRVLDTGEHRKLGIMVVQAIFSIGIEIQTILCVKNLKQTIFPGNKLAPPPRNEIVLPLFNCITTSYNAPMI